MKNLLTLGLIAAWAMAVLGYGGTEPVYFSLVQILVFALALALIANPEAVSSHPGRFALAVPVLLLGLVLLQLAPLPALGGLSLTPHATLTHALLLLTYLAGFYLAFTLCQNRQQLRMLVLALVGLGSIEAFLGLVQYLSGWPAMSSAASALTERSATGTYINRNHFAGLLEMTLPFALALVLVRPAPGGPTATASGERRFFPARAFAVFLVVIFLTAIVFSRSRMGILAALVSLLAMGALAGPRGGGKRSGIGLVPLSLAGGLLLAAWIGLSPVVERFTALPAEFSLEAQGRRAIWKDSLALIRARPWLGNGLGSFPLIYPSVQAVYPTAFVNHAHNDYVELAVDLGLPATLLLVGALLILVVRLGRRVRAAHEGSWAAVAAVGCFGGLLALLLHGLTDFNLYIPANALLFASLAGMAANLSLGRTLS